MHAFAQRILDRGASRVPSELTPVTTILEGHPGAELARRALAYSATCVVVGSRAYGPLRAVLLGGATQALLDDASTPVLVAPRPAAIRAAPAGRKAAKLASA
ncbi:MAG: universal stress protein [Actinomycetota bacterium]|nr:universal stress protein [Actinomycetota bacterium]